MDKLTNQERNIVTLIAQNGASNKEMADVFKVSVRTVETHVAHIEKKLDIHSARKLTLWCVQHATN